MTPFSKAPSTNKSEEDPAFKALMAERNVDGLLIGSTLVAIFVPLFWALDWYVIPRYVIATFTMRMFVAFWALVAIIAARRTREWTKRHIAVLSLLPPGLLPAWSIAVMCFMHTGYESPYYVGLILVFMNWSIVFTHSKALSFSFFALMYGFYIAPLLLGLIPIRNLGTVVSNQCFLLTAIVLTSATQVLRYRRDRREFEMGRGLSSSGPAILNWLIPQRAPNRREYGLPSHTIGRYEILRRLGVGGMAETFAGRVRGPGSYEQRVCIKCVLPSFMEDPGFIQLFLDEARITAALHHANIVHVVEFGRDERANTLYLALELIEGMDLRNLLRRQPNKTLPWPIATLIAFDLALALDYAHTYASKDTPSGTTGIIHRDISPSNILLSVSGAVKLTDFGIAKEMRGDSATHTTGFKGKLTYIAPEHLRAERLDGRSDLFSLGVTLYEALVGMRPFDGNSDLDTVQNILKGKHDAMNSLLGQGIPKELIETIEWLLKADPKERCPSASALLDALSKILPPATTRRDLAELVRRCHQPIFYDDTSRTEKLIADPSATSEAKPETPE